MASRRMETQTGSISTDVAAPSRPWLGMWRRLWRKGSFRVGGAIVLLLVLVAAFAPWLATHDPLTMIREDRLSPPSSEHYFGTDEFGRDIFSRLVFGARLTLRIGVISVGISLLVGGSIGLLSGYLGGWVDLIVMRIIDVMLAFPFILLALAIVAVLGPGLENTMIAVGVAAVPAFARLVRSSTLVVREQVYVEAAQAVGAGHFSIMVRHILPNVAAPLVVLATLQFPAALLSAAALGFIGLGAQPPTPEWGAMLVAARTYLRVAPWMANIPGVAIMLTVLGFNLLGNAARDVLDPTQRHS